MLQQSRNLENTFYKMKQKSLYQFTKY
jgi:hypothetical protein